MQEPPTLSSRLHRKPNKTLATVVAVLVFAGVAVIGMQAVSRAMAQPTKNDVASLEKQRTVVDVSIESYEPVLNDFSREYNLAYIEKFSEDKKAALYKSAKDTYNQEARINNQRIAAMSSSTALKNSKVNTSFKNFKNAYQDVTKYYDIQLADTAALNSSINGQCAEITVINPTSPSYATDFVKAADTCLATLKTAKESTGKETARLISSVEKMVKETRDLFDDIPTTKNDEYRAKGMIAVASLAAWNTQNQSLLTARDNAIKKEYAELAQKMNNASTALKKAIDVQLSQITKSGKE